MKNLLEKAIVCLLNEQHDKANELMHRFMVARARQIHESLRSGDESVLDEDWNDELSEEYYSDEDLDGLEGDHADDVDGDVTADLDDAKDDLDDADADIDAADDLGGDLGDDDGDVDGDEGSVEISDEDLDDFRDQLENLRAKLDSIINSDDDEVDASELSMDDDDGDLGGDDLDGSDEGDDFGGDDEDGKFDDTMDDEALTDENTDDEPVTEDDENMDFDDIAESIAADLAKISVDMTKDGVEQGGKSIEQNKKSSVGGKKAEASEAHPIEVKSKDHAGYEREPAPAVKPMSKKSRNAHDKADAGRSTVSKEGNKSALINKDFAK